MSDTNRFYGKYRGTVVSNIDPMKMGRLLVIVPDVSIAPGTWAMPCFPTGGLQNSAYFIPMQGAGVWVEFEQGDTDHPIWTGCWIGGPGDLPPTTFLTTPGVPVMVIESPAKSGIVLSDVPVPPMIAGGVMIKSGLSSVVVGPDGVTITAPKVEINGVLIVNKGALTVTL